MPPVSGAGTNHQKNLITTHGTSAQQPSSMQNDVNPSMANYGNPAVNPEIVKGQELDDLKSFNQAFMDWEIYFSAHTVKSDK